MSDWVNLRRLQPVSDYFKGKESQQKILQRVLRSKNASKTGLGRALMDYLNNEQDNQKVTEFFNDVFEKNVDSNVAQFVKNIRYSMTLQDLNKENIPNDMTEIKPLTPEKHVVSTAKREIKDAPKPDDQPTSLQRLNQVQGVPDMMEGVDQNVGGNTHDPIERTNENGNTRPQRPARPMGSQQTLIHENEGQHIEDSAEFDEHTNFIDEKDGDTLRKYYEEATKKDVKVNEKASVMSNVNFDLFSYVPPGFGNGVDNKLFNMDVNHKRKIEWNDPMYMHRGYNGPEMGISPMPVQFKEQMTNEQYLTGVQQQIYPARMLQKARKLGMRSSIPREPFVNPSCKGLPGRGATLFNKQIQLNEPFFNTVTPCGSFVKQPHIRPYDPCLSRELHIEPAFNTVPKRLALQTTHDMHYMS